MCNKPDVDAVSLYKNEQAVENMQEDALFNILDLHSHYSRCQFVHNSMQIFKTDYQHLKQSLHLVA